MGLKKRTQEPPFYRNYRLYKQSLRIEFDHRCAYCGIREPEDGGSGKFHIDHYRPKKKFPKQVAHYPNLFYSCSDCNRSKSDYWPNPIKQFLRHIILNPCDHDYEIHYNAASSEWKGNTAEAHWNIYKLRLNSSRKIQVRKDRDHILSLIENLTQQKTVFENLVQKSNIDSGTFLEQDIKKITETIAVLNRKISGPHD